MEVIGGLVVTAKVVSAFVTAAGIGFGGKILLTTKGYQRTRMMRQTMRAMIEVRSMRRLISGNACRLRLARQPDALNRLGVEGQGLSHNHPRGGSEPIF